MTRQGEELERDMREMPKVFSLEGSFFTDSAKGRIGARYEGNAESMPLGESYRETLFFLIKFIWLFAFPGEEIVLNGFSLYFVRGLG